MKQPIFEVRIEATGALADIRMNDGPLFQTAHPAPMQTEVPDIFWVRSGTNEISCRLSPARGQTTLDPSAECLLIVSVGEKDAASKDRIELTRLAYHMKGGSEVTGKLETTPEGIVVRQTFQAEAPFVAPEWLTAPMVQDIPETLAALTGELKKFHQLLETKNLDALLAAVDARDRVCASHMYKSLDEQKKGTKREYSMLMRDEILRPVIDSPEKVKLRIFGNGHLARVDLRSNHQSPLYYLTQDKKNAAYVTLIFAKTPEKGWTIVR